MLIHKDIVFWKSFLLSVKSKRMDFNNSFIFFLSEKKLAFRNHIQHLPTSWSKVEEHDKILLKTNTSPKACVFFRKVLVLILFWSCPLLFYLTCEMRQQKEKKKRVFKFSQAKPLLISACFSFLKKHTLWTKCLFLVKFCRVL